ncbi:Signal transduction histidine-protein kinase ArlS [Streptomyces sp. YIM 130001]|uniref:sensor histidine kinase n=1 Tax=Streptomyces sp. YIM 130001 TaxID=2259644 RepID=UPI000E65D483|nr:HAMP domain-containing sensor histidine kinase [Streptomyces sp. YIM 130001]RII15728.1 Signal transduction histidine-protein kinase ArlS [Streptomyces sp. YIM 130001]
MSRRPLFASVRARAAVAATAVVALALVVAGAALLLSLRTSLTNQADSDAETAARRVAAQLASGVSYAKLELPDGEDAPVQVVDGQGRLRSASEDLEAITGTGVTAVRPGADAAPDGDSDSDGDSDNDGDDDDDPEPGRMAAEAGFGEGSATVDGDTAEYRFARVELTTRSDESATVYAGAPLAAERGAVDTATTAMLVGVPVLLVVVATVTWLVTRRALRPVEGIRREMATITASEDLSRRVPQPDTYDEVAALARTTNETLGALEASVERQRRFVADASHELRSPIASLRTQLEVGAAHPELLDVDGAVVDTVRLQQLAADLLLLARLDAGERPGEARIALPALVREELSQRTADRIDVRGEPAGESDGRLEVTGSRGQLARVLGNLLDNAQRHARSRVTVTTRVDGGFAVIGVADDGTGVPEDERERIFERFVRLDDARSRDDGGAGLGLAIARDVAERHGGRLTVGGSADGGALFELWLPRSLDGADGAPAGARS